MCFKVLLEKSKLALEILNAELFSFKPKELLFYFKTPFFVPILFPNHDEFFKPFGCFPCVRSFICGR